MCVVNGVFERSVFNGLFYKTSLMIIHKADQVILRPMIDDIDAGVILFYFPKVLFRAAAKEVMKEHTVRAAMSNDGDVLIVSQIIKDLLEPV